VRKKALVPGAQTAGSWGWTYEGEDGPHATIQYEADLRDTDNAWLHQAPAHLIIPDDGQQAAMQDDDSVREASAGQ
jgi:hypothetical protein